LLFIFISDKIFFYLENNEQSKIFHGAQFILDACQFSPNFCLLKPSFQAAICLYLSKKIFSYNTIYKGNIWTNENGLYTRVSENEIKKILKLSIKIIKDLFSDQDYQKTTIFKKYSNSKYSNISKIFEDLIKKKK
jgi:hypothetical protein